MKKPVLFLMLLMSLFKVSAQTATVQWNTTYQAIQGWGGSTGYLSCYLGCPTVTSNNADLFWSQSAGIGLHFVRSGNSPDGTVYDLAWLQAAQARGAKVYYSFISPPASMMSNGQFAPKPSTGAYLIPSNYSAYAVYMVTTIRNLQSNGVMVYAISVQNEPDSFAIWKPPGPACGVSRPSIAQCLSYFISTYLGPAWTSAGLGSILIGMPEDGGWFKQNFVNTCMGNPNCAKYVAFVPSHDYDGTNLTWGFTGNGGYCCAAPTTPPSSIGTKPTWMTEVNGGFSAVGCSGKLWAHDAGMADALVWAHNIWGFLTIPDVQTYMYYNLWGTLDEGIECNDGLTNSLFRPTKRYYVFGNWSKFVHSGWLRIGVTSSISGVYLSAFKAPDSSSFTIVAVNSNGSSQPIHFAFSGVFPSSVTPYITDAKRSLAAQSPIGVSSGSFFTTLSASSVTSFTGTIPPRKPM